MTPTPTLPMTRAQVVAHACREARAAEREAAELWLRAALSREACVALRAATDAALDALDAAVGTAGEAAARAALTEARAAEGFVAESARDDETDARALELLALTYWARAERGV